MSKAEARIARKAERALKQAEKSARLLERPDGAEIRLAVAPEGDRAIRAGANPGSIYHMKMTWTVDTADCEGAWESGTPRQWGETCWDQTISPKLAEWQKLTWGEIDQFTTGGKDRHKMHHSMDMEILADEAQYRAAELEKFSDTIFRFRLGSTKRLWGFRVVNHFEVIWYDPNHEIYPTEPA
jgi:hypothetical protein